MELSKETLIELLSNCIGTKDFSTLSSTAGAELGVCILHFGLHEHYHLEYKPSKEITDWTGAKQQTSEMYFLYRIKDWRASQERLAQAKIKNEQNRQQLQESEQHLDNFKTAMKLKGKQPSEIKIILEKIYTYVDPYYSLGVRYKLIDPNKVKVKVEDLDALLKDL